MLNVNNQSEQAQGFSKFIGLGNLTVETVNPTKDEFKAIYGRDLEKEPVYWDAASSQRKLVFYYKSEGMAVLPTGKQEVKQVNGTYTVFLKNELEVTKAGDKKMYMDKFGSSVFLSDLESKQLPEKFKIDAASLRLAFKGEADLTDFMKAIAAPARNDQFFIPEINKIIQTGNVAAIRYALEQAKKYGNTIRALLGIRTAADGKKYQTIYKKKIDRGTNTTYEYLWKSLVSNKDHIKEYYGDFNFGAQNPDPKWFMLREYYPGMEGNMLGAQTTAAPVANFTNVFAGLNPTNVPGSSDISPEGFTSAYPSKIPSATLAAVNTAFDDGDDDDLPF